MTIAQKKVVRRGPEDRGPRRSLRSLREAMELTQQELARAGAFEQSEVSKIERRDDAKLSTLRRYVEALGAELDLVVTFPKTGHRFRVDLADTKRNS